MSINKGRAAGTGLSYSGANGGLATAGVAGTTTNELTLSRTRILRIRQRLMLVEKLLRCVCVPFQLHGSLMFSGSTTYGA
nr:uncharacterized protein CTRU02_06676 [Colletotrichum truncatum]KAF6792593.1 hypothetical protein CTRU02_06676 [Colletotrichum truncatum]